MQASNENIFKNVLYAVLCLGALFLIWSNPFFVTQDGGTHLHNAQAFKSFYLYTIKNYFHQFYTLNDSLAPNIITTALLSIFTDYLSPANAEQLLVSIYVFTFVWSMYDMAKQLGNNNTLLVVLCAFAIVFNGFVFKGFYNFLISIVLFLFCLNIFLSLLHRASIRKYIGLIVLTSLLYCTQIFGFALFGISSFIFLFAHYIQHQNDFKKSKFIFYAILFIPSLILFFSYSSFNDSSSYFSFENILFSVKDFFFVRSLSSIGEADTLVNLLFIILLLFVACFKICTNKINFLLQPIVLNILVYGILYLIINDTLLGGEQVKIRIQFVIVILLILFLDINAFIKKQQSTIYYLFLFFSVLLLYTKYKPLKAASTLVANICTLADTIPSRSYVLPISYNNCGVINDKAIATNATIYGNHIGNYILSNSKAIAFADNYQANTNLFLLKYTSYTNYFTCLSNMEAQPPTLDFEHCKELKPIDYIVVFNIFEKDKQTQHYQTLITNIQKSYQLLNADSSNNIYLYKKM